MFDPQRTEGASRELAGKRVLLAGKQQPLSAHHAADTMSSALSQPQKGNVPQQGCSHGFQRLLNVDSC